MQVKDVTRYLETIAPLHLQAGYDNAGLIVGAPEMNVSGILLSLDTTEPIVEEAIEQGCNLIVAHHPIIFKGLKKINGKNYVERTIIKAIKNNIAIYAIHTNLDHIHHQGVNSKIAERIGLEDCAVLAPEHNSDSSQEIGAGLIGELPSPISMDNFLDHVKERMKASCIKYTALLEAASK